MLSMLHQISPRGCIALMLLRTEMTISYSFHGSKCTLYSSCQ